MKTCPVCGSQDLTADPLRVLTWWCSVCSCCLPGDNLDQWREDTAQDRQDWYNAIESNMIWLGQELLEIKNRMEAIH
jgi:hypothetical protein